jgi:hypothetical protein
LLDIRKVEVATDGVGQVVGAVNSTVELRIDFHGKAPTSEAERAELMRDVEYLVVCETVVLRTVPTSLLLLPAFIGLSLFVAVKWAVPGLLYTLRKAALLPTIVKKN